MKEIGGWKRGMRERERDGRKAPFYTRILRRLCNVGSYCHNGPTSSGSHYTYPAVTVVRAVYIT